MTHKIQPANTLWIFVTSTIVNDLSRHTQDNIYTIHNLIKLGVPETSIKVFTNKAFMGSVSSSFIDHSIAVDVEFLGDLSAKLSSYKGFENAVMIIGGHGSYEGIHIDKTNFLKPFEIFQSMRSITSIKTGTLILCQCYSGIFNYMDAESEPKLFLMAGTSLKLSLSLQIDLDTEIPSVSGNSNIKSWAANPFQFYFTEWIANPVDIDGDGLLTFLDSYRYSSSKTNEKTISIKGKMFTFYGDQLKSFRDLYQKQQSAGLTPDEETLMSQILDALQSTPVNLFNVESPWLLNPRFGKLLHF